MLLAIYCKKKFLWWILGNKHIYGYNKSLEVSLIPCPASKEIVVGSPQEPTRLSLERLVSLQLSWVISGWDWPFLYSAGGLHSIAQHYKSQQVGLKLPAWWLLVLWLECVQSSGIGSLSQVLKYNQELSLMLFIDSNFVYFSPYLQYCKHYQYTPCLNVF